MSHHRELISFNSFWLRFITINSDQILISNINILGQNTKCIILLMFK